MLLGEKIWKEGGLVYKHLIGLAVGNRIGSLEAVSSRDEVWENYWQQDGVQSYRIRQNCPGRACMMKRRPRILENLEMF